MNEALIECLYGQFMAGKATDGSGFKPESWPLAIDAVRRAYRGTGNVDEAPCRNKWTWFKETWKNFKILEGMSGMGWDEVEERFTADNKVWDGLAKVQCT